MASRRHLDAVWNELRKTPPFRRIVLILGQEATEDGQNAVIKHLRIHLTDDLKAACPRKEIVHDQKG